MSTQPPTKLGHYRLLSPLSGVHVSPFILGGGSIGDQWQKHGMGAMNKEDSFKLLDAFYEKGGNFIDTANEYQEETSEMFIGEWAEQRDIRDHLFIATKYSSDYKRYSNVKQQIMYTGNSTKSLHLSVEASLKKLRTTYIDLLYVHYWDWDTGVEEVMRSLHNLVVARKVLYLGISDSPAWVVAKANQYARDHALSPFVIYQGRWNLIERSLEREIIPMARSEGLAIAPWDILRGGKFRTDQEEERRRDTGENGRTMFAPEWERNEKEKIMSRALEVVAKEVGAKHITAVAIAYMMQKTVYVFPLIGGRRVEQLEANLEALDLLLTEKQMKYLENALDFDIGFPLNFIGDGTVVCPWLSLSGHVEPKPSARPLQPESA